MFVVVKILIILMIPRYFFPSLYAGTENPYTPVIWKGVSVEKVEKKTTPHDVCKHMIEEVSNLSRQMLSGKCHEATISYRDDERKPFDVLNLTLKKEKGLSHLEILNVTTDSLDPVEAGKLLKNGEGTDAFGFIIIENDPICPERVFEVECRFLVDEKNIVVVRYNTDSSEIFINYANPELNITKEDLKSEEAWFYLQSLTLCVMRPLKDFLEVYPEGVFPHENDKGTVEPEPNHPEPEKYQAEKDLGIIIPIAHQPSWLQSVWQASHTPVVHSDQQVQKMREEQADKSTGITICIVAVVLFCFAVWAAFSPIVVRRIKRYSMQRSA